MPSNDERYTHAVHEVVEYLFNNESNELPTLEDCIEAALVRFVGSSDGARPVAACVRAFQLRFFARQ